MTDKLEEWLDKTLRELPPRAAPGTLEARVMGELRRRATKPWWQRSFAHWPPPARVVFVAMAMCMTALVTVGSLHAPDLLSMLPLAQIMRLVAAATALAAAPTHLVSPAWMTAALAAGTLLYVMLFGLGAVAYRTLYLKPQGAG
jgi:hypothetical protein